MGDEGGRRTDCWTVDDAMDHTKVSDFILRRENVITRFHHSTGVELFELYNGINWHGFSCPPVAFGMPMAGSHSAIIRLHRICLQNWLRTSHLRLSGVLFIPVQLSEWMISAWKYSANLNLSENREQNGKPKLLRPSAHCWRIGGTTTAISQKAMALNYPL